MDKTGKFLKRLNEDERALLEKILRKVEKGDLSGLDVKKLKGESGLFRVRKGPIRIIFQKERGATNIVSIDRRNENTYKDL